MVTVVIPLYNKAETIGRAIASVQRQTVADWELIVVDDGSSDGGSAVVETLEDQRIRVIRQANGGVSRARNRGVSEARSEWVAFLDADDEWKPEFLATCLQLLEQYPQADVIGTAYELCDANEQTHPIVLRHWELGKEGLMESYFMVAANSDPPFCSISVMIRKAALQAIGGFPEGIGQGEDLLTWARLAVNGSIAYAGKSLAIFHTDAQHRLGAPKRVPKEEDPVGKALAELPNHPGLAAYNAQWHLMRASMYTWQRGCETQARKEMKTARKWLTQEETGPAARKRLKMAAFSLLLLLPYSFRIKIIQQI